MNNDHYANKLKRVANNVHAGHECLRGPSELRQINIGVNRVGLWGGQSALSGWSDLGGHSDWRLEGSYWSNVMKSQCFEGATGVCNEAGGARTQADPYGYIDGPPNSPGSGYMAITAGVQQSLVAAMFLMPEICSIVNYPPLVEYVDRVVSLGVHAAPDPCAAPDPRENPITCDPYRDDPSKPSTCKYYRKTWGPDPEKPGACIVDRSGKGRFTSIHGKSTKLLYSSSEVSRNWEEIRGNGSYCMLHPPKIKSVYLE